MPSNPAVSDLTDILMPSIPADSSQPDFNTALIPPLFSLKGAGTFEGPASSPDGLRCPRGSFIHAPYCRFHLRSITGLDVAPSTIPDAGNGLFSLAPRGKGENLVDYFGEVLQASEIEIR